MSEGQRTIVSLRHWLEYTDVERVLAECLADVGGIERFVHPGQTVVVKPNLTGDAAASSGGTTHIELVEALLRQVQHCQPSRIVVAEGNGFFGATLESAFLHGGWREMAARMGVELYNLDGGPYLEVMLDHPHYPYPLPFSRLVLEADVFITVPCLKTHINADYTVALKNSFCLTPQWKRSEIHSQYLLEEALTDLGRVRRPDLSVVDGWDGAEGVAGGIGFDHPAGARVMLVGADPVAVDLVSREVMEQTAPTRYLRWAIEDGLGVGDPNAIEICGAPLGECRRRFMSPTEEISQAMPQLTLRDQRACSGCRCLATTALWRFQSQKMLHPLQVVVGGRGELPHLDGQVVVLGDCAKPFAALGTYLEGCPPKAEAVMSALENTKCFCHQCREIVRVILPDLPAGLLAHLQVAASGAQVHVGDQARRDRWRLILLVGNCMQHYAQVNAERAALFGLDPERDMAWVQGCPPEEAAVREAVQRLEARLAVAVE